MLLYLLTHIVINLLAPLNSSQVLVNHKLLVCAFLLTAGTSLLLFIGESRGI